MALPWRQKRKFFRSSICSGQDCEALSLGTCQIRPGGFFIDRDSVKVLGGAMEVALKVEVDQAAGLDQKVDQATRSTYICSLKPNRLYPYSTVPLSVCQSHPS